MLEVQGLVAGYGLTRVLEGVSLHVAAGEIVAVLGSNGAGKTTLNMALSGLVRPREGRVTFEGEDITGRAPASIMARGLIQVPEGRRIFPNLSVRENLELGSYRRAKANRARNLERVFATFPRLKERVSQAAGTLSGGEQQMLAIGRALMLNPRLLLLDEPLEGLAPVIVQALLAAIRRIVREDGMSAIVVEQHAGQILPVTDRAAILERGRIVAAAPSAELLRDPALLERHLGLAAH